MIAGDPNVIRKMIPLLKMIRETHFVMGGSVKIAVVVDEVVVWEKLSSFKK